MKLVQFAALFIIGVCPAGFAAQESEPNQWRPDATPFFVPDTLTGNFTTLETTGQAWDYWSVSANAGTYRFVATPVNSSALFPLDLALDLENAAGSRLLRTDVGFAHQPETLEYTIGSAGTYYLCVWEATNYNNPAASYSVTAAVIASVDDWSLY